MNHGVGELKKSQAPLPGKVAALLRESKWFVLIAVALYLALVFATFNTADPGWSHSAAGAEVSNAGGRVGAWIADVLLFLFGVSAWWWIGLFAYAVAWGYRRLDGGSLSDRRPFVISAIGFAVLLLACSGLEALRLHSLKASLPSVPGGMIGSEIARVLWTTLGFTGATLILLTLCAVGLSLFTGVSWMAVAEAFGTALEWIYARVSERWQSWQDRKAGSIAAGKREAVVEERRELIEAHPPIRIGPPVVEIPKSARVQKEKQEPLFRELPDTPLPPL
jgi:S-DNA-T family DNA segregation ATPase FtsK/SpoIIIE